MDDDFLIAEILANTQTIAIVGDLSAALNET